MFRMLHWLLLAGIFYAIALSVPWPQVQTLCWKLGNVTVAAYVGYFIDRHMSRKPITAGSSDLEYIRRAIGMAAAMLSVALGL